MEKINLDLYADYLLSTFGAATATGLSAMVDGQLSHDQVTRFLSAQDYTSKDLWLKVKSAVRSVESEDSVVIIDDSIQAKPWTDESELMCWHYDHVLGRSVRGINLLNALYYSKGQSIPVAFELVKKPIQYSDIATKKLKRMGERTKNQMMREMIETCIQNGLVFRFILMDSWFSSMENFDFIRGKGKHFIAALKDNRLVALSEEDRKKKRFVRVDELDFPEQTAVQGWLCDRRLETACFQPE
jgi:SRSO17 transposase